MTMTKRIPKATPPRAAAAPVSSKASVATDERQLKTANMTPSEKLAKECIGCQLSFYWMLSKTVQVDKTAKAHMAEAAGTTENAFGASKRLMDSKHKVIKECNELKRRIESTWRSATMPYAMPGLSQACLQPGVRLINTKKYPKLRQDLLALVPEVRAMEEKLNAALPSIKDMDRARLKDLYRESDYPKEISLSFTLVPVSVDIPSGIAEVLAPEEYQLMKQMKMRQFDQAIELTIGQFLGQFKAVIESWVNRLGPAFKIFPPEGHKYASLAGAEIDSRSDSRLDPEIPAGQLKITVKRTVKAESGSESVETTELGPMTEAEYAALNPQKQDKPRVFKNSTIEAMTQLVRDFHQVADDFGASDDLRHVVRQIQNHLKQCPTVESAANELRDSITFRAQTHALMEQLNVALSNQVVEFNTKARRMVDRGGNT